MTYNEYEVLMLARTDDEDAMHLLINKYKKIIQNILSKRKKLFQTLKIDIEDAYIKCIEALDEAIYNYNDYNTTATFETYVKLIIKRKINNILRQAFSKNEQLNINAIDLSEIEINEEKAIFLSDNTYEPLTTLINDEESKNDYINLRNHLSLLEKKVLNLLIKGYKEVEIAEYLNKSTKQVYNAIQRIRDKFKQLKK